MSDSFWPHGLYSSWNSQGQNTGVGSLSLLQGIFPTQGSNPGLSPCRQILYQLSHKGSPRILESVAYPFASSFPTQESNQSLLHCWQILYQLIYEGSPFIFNFFGEHKHSITVRKEYYIGSDTWENKELRFFCRMK